MEVIRYKGKGEHSVNELELIVEQKMEELHLINSGQKQLRIGGVGSRRELLIDFMSNHLDNEKYMVEAVVDDYFKNK